MEEHKHVKQYNPNALEIEDRPGLFNKLRMGRVAIVSAGIELAGVSASVAYESADPAIGAAALNAAVVGGALYGAHQYFKNNYPKNQQPLPSLIKDKSTELK